MNQIDEEKHRAERNGTSQHSFHQQHRPTAQQEDVDKQPEDTTERHNVTFNVKEQNNHNALALLKPSTRATDKTLSLFRYLVPPNIVYDLITDGQL